MSIDLVGKDVAPNVFIKSIELDESVLLERDDDPHIDETILIQTTKTRSGKTKRTGVPRYDDIVSAKRNKEQITITNPQKFSKNLIIKAKICVYEHDRGEDGTSWYNNDVVKNYIKLKVVCSQIDIFNQAIIDGKITLDHRFYNKYQDKTTDLLFEKVVPLSKMIPLSENTKMESDNDGIYLVEYEVTFVIKNSNPKHLALFACCYVDTDQLFKDNGLMLSRPFAYSTGPITCEYVIRNFQTIKQNKMYRLSDGSLYTGPVHLHNEQGWMAGGYHTALDHPSLTEEIVPVNKIKDYRRISEIFDMVESLITKKMDITNPRRTPVDYLVSKPIVSNMKRNYFTELYLTADSNNDIRMTFGFDINKYIIESTNLKNIVHNLPRSTINEILSWFRVRSLDVYRKKVRKGLLSNDLGTSYVGNRDFAIPFEYELACSMNTRGFDTEDIQGNKFRNIGSITTSEYSNMRQLTFVECIDRGIKKSFGHYQYKVKVQLENNSNEFFKIKLLALDRAINRIDEMQFTLSDKSKLNPITNTLNEAAAIEYLRNLKSGWVQRTAIQESLSSFIECLMMLTKLGTSEATSIMKMMTHLLMPHKTTVTMIGKLLDLMKYVRTKFVDFLNINDVVHNSDVKQKNRRKTSFLEIEEEFQNTIDMKDFTGYNNDFIGIDPSLDREGLITVTRKSYEKRIQFEMEKYFESSPSIPKTDISQSYLNLYDINSVKTCYLTPIKMTYGNNTVNFLMTPEKLWDPEVFNDAVISSYSNKMFKADLLSTPKSKPKVIDNFVSTFSATIERPADELSIFAPTFDQPYNTLIESQEYLGAQSGFVVTGSQKVIQCETDEDPEIETNFKKLSSPVFLSFALTNPNLQTSPIGSPVPIRSSAASRQTRFNDSLENFDLNSSTNALRRGFGTLKANTRISSDLTSTTYTPRSSAQMMTNLPNQLKSIFLGDLAPIKKNWFNKQFDFLKRPEFTALNIFHYKSIMRVEYLSGFEVSSDSRRMLKAPIWKLLTDAEYTRLGSEDILVRLVKYENKNFNTYQADLVGLDPINTVFVLKGPNSPIQQRQQPTLRDILQNVVSNEIQKESIMKNRFSTSQPLKSQNMFTTSRIIDRVPLKRTSIFTGKKLGSRMAILPREYTASPIFNPGSIKKPMPAASARVNGLITDPQTFDSSMDTPTAMERVEPRRGTNMTAPGIVAAPGGVNWGGAGGSPAGGGGYSGGSSGGGGTTGGGGMSGGGGSGGSSGGGGGGY